MICSFYSFKGGVGRSMALANVAELLCRRGLRVLMVDLTWKHLAWNGSLRYEKHSILHMRS